MINETFNKLLFNFFLDNKKKEIDKVERANLLQNYIKDNNITQRELAKQLNMSHSTLQDWIMYSRIEKEDYDALIGQGYDHKQIYKTLRDTKKEMPSEFKRSLYAKAIQDCKSKLSPIIKESDLLTNVEITELNELKNIINRIMLHYEQGLKSESRKNK